MRAAVPMYCGTPVSGTNDKGSYVSVGIGMAGRAESHEFAKMRRGNVDREETASMSRQLKTLPSAKPPPGLVSIVGVEFAVSDKVTDFIILLQLFQYVGCTTGSIKPEVGAIDQFEILFDSGFLFFCIQARTSPQTSSAPTA